MTLFIQTVVAAMESLVVMDVINTLGHTAESKKKTVFTFTILIDVEQKFGRKTQISFSHYANAD